MKPSLFKAILIFALLGIEAVIFVKVAQAFPSSWRLPMYNEGRAVISNGPGEGDHTGVDAQAIDYFSVADPWYTNRKVHAAHAGTVKVAGFYACPGNVLGSNKPT